MSDPIDPDFFFFLYYHLVLSTYHMDRSSTTSLSTHIGVIILAMLIFNIALCNMWYNGNGKVQADPLLLLLLTVDSLGYVLILAYCIIYSWILPASEKEQDGNKKNG